MCRDYRQTYLRKDWQQHGNGKCVKAAPPATPVPVAPQPILCQYCGHTYFPEWVGEHLNGVCVQPRPMPQRWQS